MFFLLRCIFWLGLVFFAMDWNGPAPLPTPEQVATEAAARCMADPQLCAQVLATAQKLHAPATASAAGSASADSLRASDRAPAWTGPKP